MTDIMTYQAGMQIIQSSMMEDIFRLTENYNPATYTEADVRLALAADETTPLHFAALLSDAALPFLEEMAQKAKRETVKRFGNSVYLFTPLYISNHCENHCVYCGFNCRSGIHRARLGMAEIEREMQSIKAAGLEEILLLTGESPKQSNVRYIGEACKIARKYFKVVGLETYPVNIKDYIFLHACGADFVTVFQETYDTGLYEKLHLAGNKRVFPYRFYAQERALIAGIRGVGFAALLGLGDYKLDAYATALHAALIQKKYPHAEITLSCPRLRPIENESGGRFKGGSISERQLLQVMTAYRLFLPQANIVISSREKATFRDNVVGIAATKISAGVDVGIGRHSNGGKKGDAQFEIDDNRSVAEIYEMLKRRSLQPVMSEYIYV